MDQGLRTLVLEEERHEGANTGPDGRFLVTALGLRVEGHDCPTGLLAEPTITPVGVEELQRGVADVLDGAAELTARLLHPLLPFLAVALDPLAQHLLPHVDSILIGHSCEFPISGHSPLEQPAFENIANTNMKQVLAALSCLHLLWNRNAEQGETVTHRMHECLCEFKFV